MYRQIGHLRFKKYISHQQILHRIQELAAEINHNLKDKNPILITTLKGAKPFSNELEKHLTIPHESDAIRLKSYEGTESTGSIKVIQPLSKDITNRTVVVLEDIIDSGITMDFLIKQLKSAGATEIYIAVLLFKKQACKIKSLQPNYCAFEIPNDFVVGFGLDYNEKGRDWPEIYVLAKDTA